MTSRRRIKRFFCCITAAVLLLIWVTMVIRVNILHPPIPSEIHYFGDTFTYADRAITMTDFRIIDGYDTKALLAKTDEDWYKEIIEDYDPASIRMGLLSIRVRNVGDTVMDNGPGSMGWAMMITSIDSLSYSYEDVSAVINEEALGTDWRLLAQGEEKEYTIVYFLDSNWVSAAEWAKVDTMTYEFILDDYPVEIRLSTRAEGGGHE